MRGASSAALGDSHLFHPEEIDPRPRFAKVPLCAIALLARRGSVTGPACATGRSLRRTPSSRYCPTRTPRSRESLGDAMPDAGAPGGGACRSSTSDADRSTGWPPPSKILAGSSRPGMKPRRAPFGAGRARHAPHHEVGSPGRAAAAPPATSMALMVTRRCSMTVRPLQRGERSDVRVEPTERELLDRVRQAAAAGVRVDQPHRAASPMLRPRTRPAARAGRAPAPRRA